MSNWKIITPEATTNIVANPSFEDGTTGWTTGGTNTITQDSTEQRRGVYSLKCAYSNNAILASYALTLTAESHAVGVDIYVPSAYTGTAVSLNLVGFASMTGTTSINADMTNTDQWHRVELVAVPNAGDLVGTLEIKESGTPGAAEFIYIDGVQVEAGTYATTYTDTTRDALDATGGKVNDLSDDLHFTVSGEDGTGMPPVSNLSSPLALQPGALFEDQTIDARIMTLTGSIVGDSLEDFHSKRKSLISALNPKTVKINQRAAARTFRYTGADVEKEIRAVYDGGMERGLHQKEGFGMMDIPLRLKADDPMFYEVGESGTELSTTQSISVTGTLQKKDGVWQDFGVTVSPYTVYKYAENSAYVYAGGNYPSISGVSSPRISRYNKSTESWEIVGSASGANDDVRALALAPNGDLYIGGDFTSVGGVAVNYIAKWNGSTWSALGSGLNNIVKDIEIDSLGNVYACGSFTTAGGAGANYIAKWNGSTWSALGSGLGGDTLSLAIDKNDNVFASGIFSSPYDAIAKWNGSTWEGLTTGFNNGGAANDMIVDDSNNLYVTGSFDEAGDIIVNWIAKWNGSTWSALGSGLSGGSGGIGIDFDNDGNLLAVGYFTEAGGNPAPGGIAKWNGSAWSTVGIDSGLIYHSISVSKYTGDIYLALATNATIDTEDATEIEYNGTESAYLSINIKRDGGTSGTLHLLRNETTGAELVFNYPLQDGELLTINTNPGEQKITSSAFGDVFSKIAPGSSFGNFFLMSGNTLPQNNVVTAFVTETGSPTITATMTYRTTYMSID